MKKSRLILYSFILIALLAIAASPVFGAVSHFTGVATGNANCFFVGTLTISGAPADTSDEVGVFTSGGVLVGAANVINVNGTFNVAAVGGTGAAQAGDTLIFKVWDASEGIEITVDAAMITPQSYNSGAIPAIAGSQPVWTADLDMWGLDIAAVPAPGVISGTVSYPAPNGGATGTYIVGVWDASGGMPDMENDAFLEFSTGTSFNFSLPPGQYVLAGFIDTVSPVTGAAANGTVDDWDPRGPYNTTGGPAGAVGMPTIITLSSGGSEDASFSIYDFPYFVDDPADPTDGLDGNRHVHPTVNWLTGPPSGEILYAEAAVGHRRGLGEIATVTVSGGGITGQVNLTDDGFLPDETANDGIYSGYANAGATVGPGPYTFTATDSNGLGVEGQSPAITPTAMVAPHGIAPGNNINSLTPQFQWDDIRDADGYTLRILSTTAPTTAADILFTHEVTGTSYTLTGSDLAIVPGTTYYWFVEVFDANHDNYYASQVRSFVADLIVPTVSNVAYDKTGPFPAGNVTFTITFDEPMDGAVPLTVQFGPAGAPDKTVAGDYIDATTWQGTYPIGSGYDGPQTLSISGGADLFGNAMAADTSATFTVDTTKPGVSSLVLNPASPVKAGVVTFTITFNEDIDTGAGEPTVDFGAPTKAVTGSWTSSTVWTGTYTIAAGYDGSQTISVSGASDLAGNTMDADTSNTFVVDTTKPVVSVSLEEATYGLTQTGVSLTPTDAGAVTIYYQVLTSDPGAGFTPTAQYTAPFDLAAGGPSSVVEYWLAFYGQDAAGNASDVSVLHYTIDTNAPVTNVSFSPQPNLYDMQYYANVATTVTLTSPQNTIYYTTNGDEPTESSDSGASPVTLGPFSTEAVNQIRYFAKNAQNIPETTKKETFLVIDLTAPADPTITAPTTPTNLDSQDIGGGKVAHTAIYRVGTADPVVAIDNETAWTYTQPLAEGNNPLEFFAQDAAGNTSGNVLTSVNLDTVAPLTAGHNPARNTQIPQRLDSQVVVHITDDNSEVDTATIKLSVNGQDFVTGDRGIVVDATDPLDVIVTHIPDVLHPAETNVPVTVDAKDKAGNVLVQDAYTFLTGASVVVTPVTAGVPENQAFEFTASQGSPPYAWTVTPSAGVIVSAPAQPTTSITFPADGPYTVRVTDDALDQADATVTVVDPIAITDRPANDVLASATTHDFAATGGTGGTGNVVWSIKPGDGGSIDPTSGLFTAPTVPTGSVQVTIIAHDATYNAGSATPVKAEYTLTVFGTLAITPSYNIGLVVGDTFDQFVLGGGNADSGDNIWSTVDDTPVAGGPVGTIAEDGADDTKATFTAQNAGTIKVKAQDSNGLEAFSGVIEVVTPIAITDKPTNDVLASATPHDFAATGGTGGTGNVVWSIKPGDGGSIDPTSGLFTAPTVPTGSVQVTIIAHDATYNAGHPTPIKVEYTLTVFGALAISPSYNIGLVVGDTFDQFVLGGGNADSGDNTWSTVDDTPVAGGPVGTIAEDGVDDTKATFTAQNAGTIKVKAQDSNGLEAFSGVIEVVTPIAITDKPTNDVLASATPHDFAATGGTDGTGNVVWSIKPGDGGSIDPTSGLFTAPTVPTGSVQVTIIAHDATYNAGHPTPIKVEYTLTVFGALAITPSYNIGLAVGDTFDQFVLGGGNADSGDNTWSTEDDTPVAGGPVGTIAEDGADDTKATFTAQNPGTIKVKAQDSNGLVAFSGVIEVVAPIAINGQPANNAMTAGNAVTFSATGGRGNTGDVVWEASVGSITADGVYTAPPVPTGTLAVIITAYDKTYNKSHSTPVKAQYTALVVYPVIDMGNKPAGYSEGTPATYKLLAFGKANTLKAADTSRSYNWSITKTWGDEAEVFSDDDTTTLDANPSNFTTSGAGIYKVTMADAARPNLTAIFYVKVAMRITPLTKTYESIDPDQTFTVTGGPATSVYLFEALDLGGTPVTAANCGEFATGIATNSGNDFALTNDIPSLIAFRVVVTLDESQYDTDPDVARLMDAGLHKVRTLIHRVIPVVSFAAGAGAIVSSEDPTLTNGKVACQHKPTEFRAMAADGSFNFAPATTFRKIPGVEYYFMLTADEHVGQVVSGSALTAATAADPIVLEKLPPASGTLTGTVTLTGDPAPFEAGATVGTSVAITATADGTPIVDGDGNIIRALANPTNGVYTFPVPGPFAGATDYTVSFSKIGYINTSEALGGPLTGAPLSGTVNATLTPKTIVRAEYATIPDDGDPGTDPNGVTVTIKARAGVENIDMFDGTAGEFDVTIEGDLPASNETRNGGNYTFQYLNDFANFNTFTFTVVANITGIEKTFSDTYVRSTAPPTVRNVPDPVITGITDQTIGNTTITLPPGGLIGAIIDSVDIVVAEADPDVAGVGNVISGSEIVEIVMTDQAGEKVDNSNLQRFEITMFFDPAQVPEGSLQLGTKVIYQASSMHDMIQGNYTTVSPDQLVLVDYANGVLTFWVDHLSSFGVGSAPAGSAPPAAPGVAGGGGGGGCFIATAAYGSPFESHVKILRQFRDIYLLPSQVGKAFVKAYYRYSPPLADFIAEHDTLRAVVRVGLAPLVAMSYVALHTTLLQKVMIGILMLSLLVSLALVIRRKRRCVVE